jgi:hypothetical protein
MIQPLSRPEPAPLAPEAALDAITLAAALLFAHGKTTERAVVAAERLGHDLGVPVKALPFWGQRTVEIDGKPAQWTRTGNGRRIRPDRTES